ncbi:hypothetical protein [Niabella ginsenosidivorans]|nr:hypothetical protein [Niabella ginsenosidivorans]
MPVYNISITVPKAAQILIHQLEQVLKEAAYTREVDHSAGEISGDYKSIRWHIEGKVSFHDITDFINRITQKIQDTYSYSIISGNPDLLTLN